MYKLLGKEQAHLHIKQEELRQLYEQSASPELLQPWQVQQGSFLVTTAVIAAALQAAEVSAGANTVLLFWQRRCKSYPEGTQAAIVLG